MPTVSAVPPPLPQVRSHGITVISWWMMIGGVVSGFASLLLMVSPRFYLIGFLSAYLMAATVVLGGGLRNGKPWAWDGTVCAGAFLIYAGVEFALAGTTQLGWFISAAPVSAVGALLIRYLIRPDVRQEFQPRAAGRAAPDVWIRLIAAYSILTIGYVFYDWLLPKPAPVLGFVLHGTALTLYELARAALLLSIGRGLYRLSETARWTAIAYIIFHTVNVWVWVLTARAPHGSLAYSRVGGVLIVTVLSAIRVWYLIRKRGAFRPSQWSENAAFISQSS